MQVLLIHYVLHYFYTLLALALRLAHGPAKIIYFKSICGMLISLRPSELRSIYRGRIMVILVSNLNTIMSKCQNLML